MRPIFTSPNEVQTQVIQSMLRQHGIETSLIEKKDVRQSYNLPKVVWSELWLRDNLDTQSATTAITQFQFNTFRQNLRVSTPIEPKIQNHTDTQELPPKADIETAVDDIEIAVDNVAAALQDEVDETDGWLPVNNKRVFNYLAKVLGMVDHETESPDFNNTPRPWNSKSLMKTVDSLKQICS